MINMKMIIKNSAMAIIVCIAMLMVSCVGDLNVKPIDPYLQTANNAYTDSASFKGGLAKLYAAFALTGQQGPSGAGDVGGVDEGFSCFIRSVSNMQELTT